MSDIQVFRRAQIEYSDYGEQPKDGSSKLANTVGTGISKTMGCGYAYFDNVSIEWTVQYDEIVVVLEGRFLLRVADSLHVLLAGDSIWIPEGTHLRYEGVRATIFYAIAPVDWRQRTAVHTRRG
ncbi:hypothetical protein BSFA1_89040 (plasmid) [Burkholderia sp. SFA1]|nr:hypothetical protein BSFA1_89040 [Burkholderia sp. SFA1]